MSGDRALRGLRLQLRSALDPRSKNRFVRALPPGASVLDVGCGNGSPSMFKRLNPGIRYTGLDIAEYGLGPADHAAADELRFVSPADFARGIADFGPRFDAIVSAHNIEHVDDPPAVVSAMCAALRPAGRLYLSFPSAASTRFPSRAGALNFHDDPTHRWLPEVATLERAIVASDCRIVERTLRNRPPLAWLIGLLVEPVSRIQARVLPFTWHFWGFESVLIAQRAG